MILAAWRTVRCETCNVPAGYPCITGILTIASHPHVARIAAGKAKRKGRHTGGRNKA
jgi:hypothetical protein